jgi:hypothetical protein
MNIGMRWIFAVTFAGSLLLIAIALRSWRAAEVRADASEVFGQ